VTTTRTCIDNVSMLVTMYMMKGYISQLCKLDKHISDNLKQIRISVVHV
jgi:hypothetical protein